MRDAGLMLAKSRRLSEEIDKIFPLDDNVKKAIASIDREIFVPDGMSHLAYKLDALPMGATQWISSPLTVAKMTTYLSPWGADSILEVGCGSGYQAAVLSRIFRRVFAIERIEKLLLEAKARFRILGITNINIRHDDGLKGWPTFAPYERILFSASVEEIPETLTLQLAEGGIIVAPIRKKDGQRIVRFVKKNGLLISEEMEPCLFVSAKNGVSRA